MSQIDGGDFSALHRSSDLGGHGVNFDERFATQTIPLYPEIRRRSKGIAQESGLFMGALFNVHGAADAEASAVEPYAPGIAAFDPFPPIVPEGWDIYLLAVTGTTSGAGAGDIVGGNVGVLQASNAQGFGLNDSGAQVTADRSIIVAQFVSSSAGVTNDAPVLLTAEGNTRVRVGMRLARGCSIRWRTVSDGIIDLVAILEMGIFPMAMGQDVSV